MAEQKPKSLVDNHYDVIGVAHSASEMEIRDAEMAVRKVYEHRAHLGDAQATDVLRRLNEASAVLLRAPLRAEYDRRPRTVWETFVDIAHSPPLVRGERLGALRAWLEEGGDVLRQATLLDAADPRHRLVHHPLLGDTGDK
jgi:hypothetical protein